MAFWLGDSSFSSPFRGDTTFESILEEKCEILLETIDGRRATLQWDLFHKFPNNLKVAAAYEIEECSNLFHEDFTIPTAKSSEESLKLRKQGNDEYKHCSNLEKASFLYTECIAAAPKNSVELALGYGNRSFILFKLTIFGAALWDVNRALQCVNCPDTLKTKLYARKQILLIKINESTFFGVNKTFGFNYETMTENDTEPDYSTDAQKAKSLFVKVGAKNKLNENVSMKVDLTETKKHGVHFIAKTGIKPGEILFSAKPFSSILVKGCDKVRCSFCFALCPALIPCEGCSTEMFCGQSCRNSAYDHYHRVECEYMPYAQAIKLSSCLKLSLRSILIATHQGRTLNNFLVKSIAKNPLVLKSSQLEERYSNDYTTICELPVEERKHQKKVMLNCALRAALALHILKKSTYFDSVTKSGRYQNKVYGDITEAESLVGTLILKELLCLRSVRYDHSDCVEVVTPLLKTDAKLDIRIIGVASYPLYARLRESCDPNVKMFSKDDRLIVFALRPIKAGEAIFKAFAANFFDVPLPKRQKMLDELNIKCECDACLHKWPVFNDLPVFRNDQMTKNVDLTKLHAEMNTFSQLVSGNGPPIKNIMNFLCKFRTTLHQCSTKPCQFSHLCEYAITKEFMRQGNHTTISVKIPQNNIFEMAIYEALKRSSMGF